MNRTERRTQARSEITRIREYLTHPTGVCPDMPVADGLTLLTEIDRLTKALRAATGKIQRARGL